MKPVTYIGYCRSSTSRQDNSIESQQQILKEFVSRNNAVLEQVYVEQLSGKKKNRPELLKAIRRVKSMKGAKLLIHKMDRLSRSLAHIATLMESRVPFVACDNPHANEITIHILAAIAQFERKQISTRIRDALVIVKQKRGKLGSPKIQELASRNKTHAREFGKQHYATLKAYRDKGMSFVKIAQTMNRKKIPAVNGTGWVDKTVARILQRGQHEPYQDM